MEGGFHAMLYKLYPMLKEVRACHCNGRGWRKVVGTRVYGFEPLPDRTHINQSINQVGEESAELMRKAARELDVAPSHASASAK